MFSSICFPDFRRWAFHDIQQRGKYLSLYRTGTVCGIYVGVPLIRAHAHVYNRQNGYYRWRGSRQIAKAIAIGDFGERLGKHCVRTYISGSRCAWWQKTTNRHTHTHTNTRDNYSNPRCAHARRGLIMYIHPITN